MKRQKLLKSTLCLLMALVCNVAWAEVLPTEPIKASQNLPTMGTPEYQFYVRGTKSDGQYWNSSTVNTNNVNSAGKFAFYAVPGLADCYYIYSVDAKKWVNYNKTNRNNQKSFVEVADNFDANAYWKITMATKKSDNTSCYQMQPTVYTTKQSGVLNIKTDRYANWYQGVDGSSTLGLWEQSPSVDEGSAWSLVAVDDLNAQLARRIALANKVIALEATYTKQGLLTSENVTNIISSPYTSTQEGSIDNLVDGSAGVTNHWHSDYSSNKVNGSHYIVANLGEQTPENLSFMYKRRNGAADDQPTRWAVYGVPAVPADETDVSDDSRNGLTLLAVISTPLTNANDVFENLPPFKTKGFKKFRIYADATNQNRGYFHIGEFQLYGNTLADSNTDAMKELAAALATAEGVENATQNDIDALNEKLSEFIASEESIAAAREALACEGIGYPTANNAQRLALQEILNNDDVIKSALDAAVTAYKETTDIILPEDGKAYTFTLVHTDKSEYKIGINGENHLQATTDGDAATFYCHAFTVGNEKRYVFISEQGKILAYQTVTASYMIVGYAANDFIAGAMCGVSSNVTSAKADRFGLIYLTAKARGATTASAGSIIYNPAGGATSFDNSSAPFHNGTLTSAIKAVEVTDYAINDDVALALAKVKAKIQLSGMKFGSYCHIDKEGIICNNLTTVSNGVDKADTPAEIEAFIASRTLNLPTPGKAYYLRNNNGTYLDIHHVGQENANNTQLATLSATKQLLYITGDESDGTWSIHTTPEGGNYLHQAPSGKNAWNTWVSDEGADFEWEVEGVDVSGQPRYMLKNISGNRNGYLGRNTPHSAGLPLFLDQSEDAKKLKMELLPVKSITLSVVTTAEWLNEESVAVPSDEVPVAVDEKYKEKVVSSGEYFYISAGRLKGVFQHRGNSGNNRTDIVAVEVIDLEGKVVASDYHWGYAGNNSENNIYTMDIPKDGLYYIRYYAEYVDNGGAHDSDVDIIYINGPAEGYYYMSNRDVERHEHLYNNALHSGNATKRLTLQSNTRVGTNNGIWRITHNLDGTMSIKNGDGNAIVPGNSSAEPTATHNQLNIEKITYVEPTPFYSFKESLNCSKSGYSLNGINILTTWAGHPDAADNQWRLDPVSVEGKTIYEVVVNGDANAYVAYNDGTTTQNAFNGGFFIADEPITEAQLKAGFVGNVVKSATITVEDNVITLADVVTFPTPVKQDLYNTSKIDPNNLTPPYRIPGITVDPETGRIITAAAELVCGTDPGYGEVDVVCRISDNNGDTWTDMIKVANGTGEESAERNIFESAFGDPAIVADRTSNEVLVIAVAGCTVYGRGETTRQNPNMIATIHSTDNGNTWGTPVNVTEDIYGLFDSGNPMQAAFVGGGKVFQSRIVKKDQYYRLYAAMCARPNGNRVIYSDDFGRTWHALGGASALPAPDGDEPKCEEMPDGRVILSSRVTGGRIYNIYTYTNTSTGAGSWEGAVTSTFQGAGHGAGGNSTNGEILIVPVQRNSDQKEMYLALQSLPTGSGRSHVGIYYKELTDVTDINSVASFATDWNGFYLVTDKSSAYSSMDLQADNRIGFIYEETLTGFGKVNNPVSTNFPNGEGQHNYDGFDNIYVAYPLEIITNNAYSIKRDVDRREFLRSYFTALADETIDELKAAVANDLETLSAEPTTAETDKLNFYGNKILAIPAFDAHMGGKIGHYTDVAVTAYKAAVVAAETVEELTAAKNAVLTSDNWNKPVSGKAYTFKNVQKDGTEYWFTYNATNEIKIIDLTTNEAEATPFVCRLLDNGKYVFVCNDGKYMTWRGSDSGNTGIRDAYDNTADAAYTDITIEKMTSGNNIDGDLSATRYVTVWGRRSATDEGCMVVKLGGQFNATGYKYARPNDRANAPFYRTIDTGTFSSAFIMEEAKAAFGNAPKVNGVGESTLMSEDLHGKHMSTFSATYATVAPEGVTAYYATKDGENVVLNAVAEDEAIPANTGVILVAEEGGNAVMLPAAGETAADVTGNLMGHSAGAEKPMSSVADAYILTGGAQGAGFYRCSGGTLAANKAYLVLPQQAGANAPAVRIRLAGTQGGTTEIEGSELKAQGSQLIYDLQGRRVLNPTKGMYIVNGKKVIF